MIVSSFIIQANVLTIVNYDRHLFIVQATGCKSFIVNVLSILFLEYGFFENKIKCISWGADMVDCLKINKYKEPWAQCYKTFLVRNLCIFVIR